ncbi:protein kinase domain-containing protein [Flectobacillus major]|uniref:protein kinase domain-containing protein n=1 Tax=Flectobacillus major TaxID=103 RepID=UPI000427D349|nr:protein kinase [Flectobacillus major]
MIGEDSFRTLKDIEIISNPNYPNEPWYSTGGLAIVFKIKMKEKFYALKCFYVETNERQERLEHIATYLKQNPSPYFVDFTYLDNELWVETAQGGNGYPVILMEWVEGKTLDNYLAEVCKIQDKARLQNLYFQFCNLAWWLQQQPIAHGDLKHDNLIVTTEGKLKLIDYDGMFVPALSSRKASELGSPCYQHPQRDTHFFNKDLDDFSLLILQITLLALQHEPNLFAKHYNGDGILLKDTDYRNFSGSSIKTTLWQLPEVKLPLLLSQVQANLNQLRAIDLMPLIQDVEWINWLVDSQERNYKIQISQNTFVREDDFYEKLLDRSNIRQAIDLALNARMEYDMYYDPFDIDILNIFKDEDSREIWAENIVNKIYNKIRFKDLTFDKCTTYEFPKNEKENRVTYYMKFEDYVTRYLLGLVIYEFKSQLVTTNSFNYNNDIFSLVKMPEIDRPPTKWIKWIEYNFFNGSHRYMAHFDVKNFFDNVNHKILLATISDELKIAKSSFFYLLLKSSLSSINECKANQDESGLIVQSLDRFFADIYLKTIDDIFLKENRVLYNRKVDDIVILFNDYSIYNEIVELIDEKMNSINLRLNTEKTELIDLLTLDNKEDKFFDMVSNSYTDGASYSAILLKIKTNFNSGKAKRVFNWEIDSSFGFQKYINQRILDGFWWEDGENLGIIDFKTRDIYGEEISTIRDDFSIITLPDNWDSELGSDHYTEFIYFMLESKLSVAMKVRILKENFTTINVSKKEVFFRTNPYYLYVLMNCMIQDFAIFKPKYFSSNQKYFKLRQLLFDNNVLSLVTRRNIIIKTTLDYLQANKNSFENTNTI